MDLVAAAGFALSAVAVAIALTNPRLEHPELAAILAVLSILAPMGLGLYAWRFGSQRFGVLLVLGGGGAFLAALSNSDSSALYTVGRVAGWGMEVAIVYALLAYPTGWLRSRADRVAVGVAVAVVALLFLPRTLFTAPLPTPSPWTGCVDDCPQSALAIFDGAGLPAGLPEVGASLMFIGVALLLLRRVLTASPLARTSLTPVLAVAIIRFTIAGSFLILRASDASDDLVTIGSAAVGASIALIAVGFFIGILRWRLRAARALERLGAGLEGATGAASLQALLAESLDDPSLRLLVRGPSGGWRDADGAKVPRPPPAPGRFALEVSDDSEVIALVVCDEAVAAQASLLRAIRAAVNSALEQERLTEMLAETRGEVAESRARIAAAADDERRRIERDLHDGAQQRLIALGIGLELAEREMAAHPDVAGQRLRALRDQVTAAIEEMRSLARGIYPAQLTDDGPAAALRDGALSLPVAVRVRDRGISRHSADVESVIFFCCREAVQNAIKHGSPSRIEIVLEQDDDRVTFEVRDDGTGFAVGASGGGITNLRDRVAAVDGELTVSSRAGAGATVRGTIPIGPTSRQRLKAGAGRPSAAAVSDDRPGPGGRAVAPDPQGPN